MRSVLLAAPLFVSACFATTSSVASLQSGFTSASQRAALAEEAVEKLEDRLAQVETTMRDQGLDRAAGRQTAEAVAADVARLRGTVEELQFTVQSLRADFDLWQLDQERRTLHAEARLGQLERLLGATPPPPPRVDGTEPVGPVSEVAPGAPAPAAGTFEERLALAEARMKEGQQAAARAILEGLSASDPSHARTAEVLYRTAETWYNEGRWRDAARAFQVVTDKHAKTSWAPWSMLRIGECFDGMGRPGDARTFYQEVVRNFAGSEAAREASRKLGK